MIFLEGKVQLIAGDCIEALSAMPESSVDACVCDPPYGLEFMGKDWDGSNGFRRSLNAADIARNNHFGRQSSKGPEYRTSGAGQKNEPGIGARDTEWVNNQGWNQFRCADCGHLFHGGSPCQCDAPKPVRADNRWNLFQQWCEAWASQCLRVLKPGGYIVAFGGTRTYHRMACGVEDAGFEVRDQAAWVYGTGFNKVGYVRDRDKAIVREGWGGALKPAWEPIIIGRKPIIGTVAENMERFGTGAINIDGCRVSFENDAANPATNPLFRKQNGYRNGNAPDHNSTSYRLKDGSGERPADPNGRWPANLIHDGSEEVLAAFPDGLVSGTGAVKRKSAAENNGNAGAAFGAESRAAGTPMISHGDSGSAARFFYSAKADADDRIGSKHPTVKPVDLMCYLVRLVTPPGGTVIDPFAGTGTTGEAAWREGMKAILIEREPEYQADIAERMRLCLAGPDEKRREIIKRKGLGNADAGPLFGGAS